MRPATLYRGHARLAIQATGCGLAAAFLAGATVLAWGQWEVALGLVFLTVAMGMLAVRVAVSRIEADDDGITLHAIGGKSFYSWEAITLIAVFDSPNEGGLLAVYTPRITLIDGSAVELVPVGCYRRAKAATIGARLDARRRHQAEAASAGAIAAGGAIQHPR